MPPTKKVLPVKEKCPHCGKGFKSVRQHLPYCSKKPVEEVDEGAVEVIMEEVAIESTAKIQTSSGQPVILFNITDMRNKIEAERKKGKRVVKVIVTLEPSTAFGLPIEWRNPVKEEEKPLTAYWFKDVDDPNHTIVITSSSYEDAVAEVKRDYGENYEPIMEKEAKK